MATRAHSCQAAINVPWHRKGKHHTHFKFPADSELFVPILRSNQTLTPCPLPILFSMTSGEPQPLKPRRRAFDMGPKIYFPKPGGTNTSTKHRHPTDVSALASTPLRHQYWLVNASITAMPSSPSTASSYIRYGYQSTFPRTQSDGTIPSSRHCHPKHVCHGSSTIPPKSNPTEQYLQADIVIQKLPWYRLPRHSATNAGQ